MSNLVNIIVEAIKEGPMPQTHSCKFCGRSFMKESTLAVHLCENKRRSQQKDEIGVRLGFQAWLRFYELTQGSAKFKTYENFAESSFYNAFVKFGRHLHSIRAIAPSQFIDWVIKKNKKIDYWCTEEIYQEYLKEYIKKENSQDALERGIVEMQYWADETNSSVIDFFRKASANRIVRMVSNGRISPWLIYCCDSGMDALSRLNEEQIIIAYPWIDPDYWQKKLKNYSADTEWCKHILTTAGY